MDEMEDRARRQLHRMHELNEQMSSIRVRETSTDGSVTVEVDGNGMMCDLDLSSAITRLSPREFEEVLVSTAKRAAAQAFSQRGELITAFNEEIAESLSRNR
ncbi:YbaB/EbfC family nucleoid-associated protein [Nocardia sp. CC227C]|uniref:YbaB/EbfC family nucleoid-associated protein n=1 Tax=Nocardia sp. CC227C TaxID=3044562 RepID=UPI00278C50C5|nr:YbaB/EbfC family nucleoid-associated protein [Nocardia sp. CC227C]